MKQRKAVSVARNGEWLLVVLRSSSRKDCQFRNPDNKEFSRLLHMIAHECYSLKQHNIMGRPKRNLLATAEQTLTPPDSLSPGQAVARVIKGIGNNLYSVELPSKEQILVELPSRFRSTIWIKRGGYVLVDMSTLADRENKLSGEIINVVTDEKEWRKQSYW